MSPTESLPLILALLLDSFGPLVLASLAIYIAVMLLAKAATIIRNNGDDN